MEKEKFISRLFNLEGLNLSTITLFGFFGAFNFPVFYLYWKYFLTPSFEDFWLQGIATLLCIPLIFVKKWSLPFKKFIRPYWYIALTYSNPFFCTYSLLRNNFAEAWELNIALALFWLMLLLDWREFVIIFTGGVTLGIGCYKWLFPEESFQNSAIVSSLVYFPTIWLKPPSSDGRDFSLNGIVINHL